MASSLEEEESVGMETESEDLNKTLSDLIKENEVTSERDILIEAIEAKLKKLQDLYKKSLDEQHDIRTKYNATIHHLSVCKLIENELYEEHERLQRIPNDREAFLKEQNELRLKATEWKEKYDQLAASVEHRKLDKEQRKLDNICEMYMKLKAQLFEETKQMTTLIDAIDAQIPKDVKTPFITVHLNPLQAPPKLNIYHSEQQIAKEDFSNDDLPDVESDEDTVTIIVDVAKFNKIKKDLDDDRIELTKMSSSIQLVSEQPSAEKELFDIPEEENKEESLDWEPAVDADFGLPKDKPLETTESDDRIELAKTSSSIERVSEQLSAEKGVPKIPDEENKEEPLDWEPAVDADFGLPKDKPLETIESDDRIELAKTSSSIEKVSEQLSAEKGVPKIPDEENKEEPLDWEPAVDADFGLPKDKPLEAIESDDRIELAKTSSSIERVSEQLSAEKGVPKIPDEENKEEPLDWEPAVDADFGVPKDQSLETIESDDRIELAKMSSPIERVSEKLSAEKGVPKIPDEENKEEPLGREPTEDADFGLPKDKSLETIVSDDRIDLAKMSSPIERVTEQLPSEKQVLKIPEDENKEKPPCCKHMVDAGSGLLKDKPLETIVADDRIDLAKMSSPIERVTQQLPSEKEVLKIPEDENKEKPLCCKPMVDAGFRPPKDKSPETVEVKQKKEEKTKPKTDVHDIQTKPLTSSKTKDEPVGETIPQRKPTRPLKKMKAIVADAHPLKDVQRISSLEVSKESTFYDEEQTPRRVVAPHAGESDPNQSRLAAASLSTTGDLTLTQSFLNNQPQKGLISKKHPLDNTIQDTGYRPPKLAMPEENLPSKKLHSVSKPQKPKIAYKPPDKSNPAPKSTNADLTPKKAGLTRSPTIQPMDKLSNQKDSKQPTKVSPKPGNKLAAPPTRNKKDSPAKSNTKASPAKSNTKASPDKPCKGNTACCSKKPRDEPSKTCNTCKSKSPKTDTKATTPKKSIPGQKAPTPYRNTSDKSGSARKLKTRSYAFDDVF